LEVVRRLEYISGCVAATRRPPKKGNNMKKQYGGKSKRIGHVVSHTHWDREWRYPIWETRLMLIEFMDELIEVLESGKYPGFLLDGQVSPVIDYLDVRPEMAPRIKALVAAGKLQIGPWLILPDEYPIDGESMIRNLLWGRRRCQTLGGVFDVGYTSFGWGQTAQLAQIYAGFGMDIAMIGKKVSKERAPFSEFLWRSPDGSELLTTRFGALGRQNFYFKVHLSALAGTHHEGLGWRYEWAKGRVAYHRADAEGKERDHYMLDAPQTFCREIITQEMLEETWATTDESLLPNDRLMLNGCDYTASQPMFPDMLQRVNEADQAPDREWVHTTMPAFVDLMRRKIDRKKLPIVDGELRDGPAAACTGNALPTRLYLKRINRRAQDLLIRFAEPMSAVAALAGAEYPQTLITRAWQFLMESHPHDSVNGVTQDKTVLDVENRLRQVIELGEALGDRALRELTQRTDMSAFRDEDILITVYNPTPYPRREVVEAWVNVPDDMPKNPFWPPAPEGLQMFDAKGKPVSTQAQGRSAEAYCVAELHTRAFPYNCQRHRVFFDAGEVPAGGYKIFRAGSLAEATEKGIERSDSLVRTSTLLKTPNIMENEFLRVEMNPNGSFNLTAKRLNRTFSNLNYFEDAGDLGDYWIRDYPTYNQIHTSLGCSARIWSEESGPLRATLVSEITMRLPKRANREHRYRVEELEDLTIRTAVTLCAGAEQVEVNVSFDNRIEDHYLRAMFPTGLTNATHADAAGHFIVDRRPIRPQGPSPEAVWSDMGTLPQNNFVDVSDGKTGLAFLNDSLAEYEVLDNEERTMALALLRAVRVWICTETRVSADFPSQKGAQCLGRHEIRYAIRPHAGDWKTANIPLEAERFCSALRLVQTRKHKGSLPAQQTSLFEIDNQILRFAAIKKAEDRDTFIVRLYNPTGKKAKGNLRFRAPVKKAWRTNLNEDRVAPIAVAKPGVIPVEADAYKIVTIEFSNGS